jgi:hypothetical protein
MDTLQKLGGCRKDRGRNSRMRIGLMGEAWFEKKRRPHPGIERKTLRCSTVPPSVFGWTSRPIADGEAWVV